MNSESRERVEAHWRVPEWCPFRFPEGFRNQSGELGNAVQLFTSLINRKLQGFGPLFQINKDGILVELEDPKAGPAGTIHGYGRNHNQLRSVMLLLGLSPPPPEFTPWVPKKIVDVGVGTVVPVRAETQHVVSKLLGRFLPGSQKERAPTLTNPYSLWLNHHRTQYAKLEAWFAEQWESGAAIPALLAWSRQHDTQTDAS